MKKAFSFFLLLVLSFCLFGCSGNTASLTSSKANNASVDLNKTVELNGLSFRVNSSWKTQISDTGIRIDPTTSSVIAASTYLNGQTADLATYIETVGGLGNDKVSDYKIEREWDKDEVHYILYNKNKKRNGKDAGSDTRLLASTNDGIGFALYFNRDGDSADYPLGDETVNQIIDSIVFTPSEVTGQNLKSSSSSNSSSSSSAGVSTAAPSVSQQNAVKKAKDYLNYTAFSYKGLIEQLEYEKFSHEDAVYGADHCGADWMVQAAKKARDYMNYNSFSRGSLIDQLEYEGFTSEQAAYGADSVGL